MTYNLHPIFVHFPIALLMVYSIIKILPLNRWFPRVAWRDIERVLLSVGVLGAFAALATGETAEHLTRPNHQLVEAHSLFAGISTWVYAVLLLGELAAITRTKSFLQKNTVVIRVLGLIDDIVHIRFIEIMLAVVALISLSITGLLGGVLAYGLSADPIAPFVLNLLGITL
ncbi:MAG: hypothetical protein RLY57_122 [Candidatus Parcubacteria bacterium]|jgi:uncharacterized membrane protein